MGLLTESLAYKQSLLALLEALNSCTDARIVVEQARFCRDVQSARIVDAQVRAAQDTGAVLSANTKTLGKDMRHDNCHLNEAGAQRAAAMWAPHLD